MGKWPLALGFACVWVVWFVLVWFVWVLLVFFSPSSSCVSFPFIDDLGTPPTWRPDSWKKKVCSWWRREGEHSVVLLG